MCHHIALISGLSFELAGRCDENGIDAMLDLAITVNTGAFGNIFRR